MATIKLTDKQREVLIAYRDNLHFNAKVVVTRALIDKGLLEDNPDYGTSDTARYYRISESGRRLLETGNNRTIVKPVKAQQKCQLCKFNPAVHAMQYVADDAPSFYALGSHIRGFAVTKVCDACKRDKQLGCVNIGARISEFTCDEKELAILQYWFGDKMDKSMLTIENLERELKKRKSMLKDAIKHPEWKSTGDPKVLSRQIEMVEFAMSIVRLIS